jgi:hypothetical protein
LDNNNDDYCLWSEKPTVLSFPSLFNGLALVVVGCLTFGLVIETNFFFVPFLELTVAILIIGVTLKRAKSTCYRVSKFGVCREQRYLPYRMEVLAFSKITNVTVAYGFFGRLFHFATVTIHSGCISCNNLVFTGIKNPETVRRLILAAKENTQ